MGGFLAASGWLLMTGSIQVMTGTRVSFATLGSLVGQAYVWQFAVGILFLMAIVLLRRIRHPLAFPVFLVVATLAVHGVLYATGTSLAAAREAHWLIDINAGVKVPDLWFSGAIARVEPWPILGAAANYGALIVVTASTVLLNTMGAEVETRIDADLDRELRITGLSNLLSGALGGMIGTLSLSRTLFSYRAGARRRIGGFVTGAVCFLTLGFGTEALGYIPVPLVGALLMQLGAAVLYEWLVEGRRRMPPLEYALLIAILLVIVLWDFVAGMAVGIIAACVIFAISSSRIRVVKRGLSRSEFGSRVDRPAEQLKQLLEHGSAIRIMWLHGFLFFGSTNSLVEELKQIVTADSSGKGCRMFVSIFIRCWGSTHRQWTACASSVSSLSAKACSSPFRISPRLSAAHCGPAASVHRATLSARNSPISMPRSNGARRSSLPNLVSRTTRCAPPMSGWHARWAAKRKPA